ncbi:MAG: hypothetical protein CVU69_07495 [Deltaproteobacteria bacterium HGW-Deltaproteobacteria-4]|nr:MAG: hypothetical protein CVU69_07495 [Deltaproteobacteria bacterium HGW-Deltaproteobacteria-4]
MKKQMKWLLAALALAALATPAFAVTADMTGTLAVRGIMTNNFDANDDAQDHGKFMDQRFRLFTSVAANENVKAVLGLEVDNVIGRTDKAGASTTYTVAGTVPAPTTPGTITIPGAAAGKDLGAMGTDKTAALEIKHLYLDFKIPSLGANVKAGSQPFNFGRGMVINDDAAGLVFTMPCPAIPDNKLELSWIKTSEATSASGEDDGDFYGAKYAMKVAGIGVAPYAGYYTAGVGALTKSETDAAFFGVDVDGKAGPFGYALTAIYNNWNNATTDGSSLSLYGKGTMAMGDTTLSLEAARMGDDKNGGNSMSLAQNAATGPVVNVSEITTGGMYTSNSSGVANIGGAATLYTTNWLYVKAGVVQKLSDSMKVSAYLAHIAQAEDSSPTTDAKTIGQEIDAYFDYTIVPGLGFNVMAAYLLADDDISATGNADNAYKLATSLNYKF